MTKRRPTGLSSASLVLFASVSGLFAAAPPAPDIPVPVKKPADLRFKHHSFVFVRIKPAEPADTKVKGANFWMTDYPDSDRNLSARFAKDTGLKIDLEGKVLSLRDPTLKQHPFIYAVEAGRLELTDSEVSGLRDYLLGGGFLMADDFWGEQEWARFSAVLKRVFPDREPIELPLEHDIFHCFYDLKEKPQVPSIQHWIGGFTTERNDAQVPHYRGLFDDHGRLMAILCHNTDLGDGWERDGDDPAYSREVSQKKAFPLGVNILVYALTR